MKKTAPPKKILGSNVRQTPHDRTVIVLTGPRECGKTAMADLLTRRRQCGFILEVGGPGNLKRNYTEAGIREHVMPWALVVICAESEEVIKRDKLLKPLLESSNVMSWSIQKNC